MNVSTRTIEAWMRDGKVPFQKIGRTVRFHWGDVRDYLSRQRHDGAGSRKQLRPVEGTRVRMEALAASIRRRHELDMHRNRIRAEYI